MLASYPSSFTTTTDTSLPEAQKDEYTGDFKGEYGIDFWNQRRMAWVAGRPIQPTSNSQSLQEPRVSSASLGTADPRRNGAPRKTSKTVARLCEVMAPPFAEEDDDIWNDGVKAVWKSLSHGDKLKYALPLPVVVRDSFLWDLKNCPSDFISHTFYVRVDQDTTWRLATRRNLAHRIPDSRRRHRHTRAGSCIHCPRGQWRGRRRGRRTAKPEQTVVRMCVLSCLRASS